MRSPGINGCPPVPLESEVRRCCPPGGRISPNRDLGYGCEFYFPFTPPKCNQLLLVVRRTAAPENLTEIHSLLSSSCRGNSQTDMKKRQPIGRNGKARRPSSRIIHYDLER